MGQSAADRQKAFRKRMKERGFIFKQFWVAADGFPGKVRKGEQVSKTGLTRDQFEAELVRVLAGADENFTARLYGELAAYGRGVRELWDMARLSPELFSPRNEEGKPDDEQPTLF